ncbi:MAG: hypothetical protein ACRDN6_00895, partial [Gaiellaceae bacterium]
MRGIFRRFATGGILAVAVFAAVIMPSLTTNEPLGPLGALIAPPGVERSIVEAPGLATTKESRSRSGRAGGSGSTGVTRIPAQALSARSGLGSSLSARARSSAPARVVGPAGVAAGAPQ